MTWEVNKLYKTRKGEQARFIGILDTNVKMHTHVFGVKSGVASPEVIRLTSEDGVYANTAEASYRPYDVISDKPTAKEALTINRILEAQKGENVKEVLLTILRENMT